MILEDKACSVIVLDHLSICVCIIYKASCVSSEDNFTDLCSCIGPFFFLSATHLHSSYWSFVLFLTYESHAFDYNVDPQICGNVHENVTTETTGRGWQNPHCKPDSHYLQRHVHTEEIVIWCHWLNSTGPMEPFKQYEIFCVGREALFPLESICSVL